MRILLDLQACQNENRFRGIGRYSLALAKALCSRNDGHEYWIALNAAMPGTGVNVRDEFVGLVPPERIVSWDMPTPVASSDTANVWRERSGALLREAVLAGVGADILLISSIFDGYHDDSVTSIGLIDNGITRTVAIVYDLIPLIYQEKYLVDDAARHWYYRKLAALTAADGWLGISQHARQEGIDIAGIDPLRSFNISGAADAVFRPRTYSPAQVSELLTRFGIDRKYVMYTGGIDQRKNLHTLMAAFARLPSAVRAEHQLVLAGKASPAEGKSLWAMATHLGLRAGEMILTGFVSDDDLVALYNLCRVFVFPSWHEGFGLPPLEAMSCGRAVIGSSATSVPEVIGRADALFDPRSPDECSALMHRVLTETAFREDLERWGLSHAGKFTWEDSARRAVEAMESIFVAVDKKPVSPAARASVRVTKPKLAMLTPLPPARSGIADYAAQLIPALSKYYEIDVVIQQPELDSAWISANCGVRDLEWFERHADRYDRIVYQIGNSTFHTYMFDLLARYPGVVVLHDFFLSSIAAYLEFSGEKPGWWTQALYASHGYAGLLGRAAIEDPQTATDAFPCNLRVLQEARGLIVHSRTAMELASRWYGPSPADVWKNIPLLRKAPRDDARQVAREALGLLDGDVLVCSFGILAYTKLNDRLIEAWLDSSLARNPRCKLVFVGDSPNVAYTELLHRLMEREESGIVITGHVSTAEYETYLAAADIAVQLRTQSRGETSAAVLDCMVNGIATIVNAHGSMAEFSSDEALVLPDEFSNAELSSALELLLEDRDVRARIGNRARVTLVNGHAPNVVASLYHEAIEGFHNEGRTGAMRSLIDGIVGVEYTGTTRAQDLRAIAHALSRNHPPVIRQRTILVDVSVTANDDLKTGIERVVRGVTLELLRGAAGDWRIEPVRADGKGGYVYAHAYACELLGLPATGIPDRAVDVARGDIFLGLDLAQMDLPSCVAELERFRLAGVTCHFVVYDMLPILYPHFFPDWLEAVFTQWFTTACRLADSLWCISDAVCEDVVGVLDRLRPARLKPLPIGSFPLGSDICASAPSVGISSEDEERLAAFGPAPIFLMVGTVEPRKGHAQVLDAFEIMWRKGSDARLVIVGKHGWMVEAFAARIASLNAQEGARVHWFERASDELLAALYGRADALVAASYGEGYGLPLIEAAVHGVPIIARDIPVFREVGSDHAFYFQADDGEGLAEELDEWLKLREGGGVPGSQGIGSRSWRDSAEALMRSILTDSVSRTWRPPC